MKSFLWLSFVLVLLACLVSASFQQQTTSDSSETIRTTLLGQVVDMPKNLKKEEMMNDPIKILVLRQDNPYEEELYYVRGDGSFSIENLTPGSHLLQLVSTRFEFSKIRVDVAKSGKMRAIAMIPSNHPSLLSPEERQAAPSVDGFGFVKQAIAVEPVLRIRPLSTNNYFEVIPGFDYFSLLKNPMVIMVVVGVLFSVVFPKMVDPELMKEAQKSIGQSENDFRNILGNLNTDQQQNQVTSEEKPKKKQSKKDQ